MRNRTWSGLSIVACVALGAACGGSGDTTGATTGATSTATTASESATGSTGGAATSTSSAPASTSGATGGASTTTTSASTTGSGGGGGSAPMMFLAGTNLSGAEFGSAKPGTYGTDYTYPTHDEVDYFVGKGFSIFRVPFLWERMQLSLGGALDATQLGYLDDVVSYATSKGARVLIDPHNYARYDGAIIGASGSSVTSADFADFWSKLAAHYASNDLVVFGLMNEPHDMDTSDWLADVNAALQSIRGAGASNTVFVPGNDWTGAHSWTTGDSGSVMTGVVDPGDNFVFEVHQYLDGDSSGTSDQCVSATIGSERLQDFTAWLVANGYRGFLGEYAGGNNATCLAAIDDMLSYVDMNRDVWLGWTWWSAGPWWGDYMFTLEPSNGMDAPQLATLLNHL